MLDPTHVDISDFDPVRDRLNFGQASSHGLVLAKTASGEPAVLNLWADAPQQQVISGVSFDDLTVANFSVVMNEHLRQDIGGAAFLGNVVLVPVTPVQYTFAHMKLVCMSELKGLILTQ